MPRQVGGAIDKVAGEEEGDGVDEDGDDGSSNEEGGDDVASSIATVASKDGVQRMRGRERRRLRGSRCEYR